MYGSRVSAEMETKAVAERGLLFSVAGELDRTPFTLRVTRPELIEGAANFAFDIGAARCSIEFEGLPEPSIEMHGIDKLHALAQAVDVDVILKGMQKKYSFYWPTGEPYFD